MRQSGKIALAVGAVALAGQSAVADTIIFQANPGVTGTNGYIQQSGNNQAYYGDVVTLTPSQPKTLTTIAVGMTLAAPSFSERYTPNTQLDIFAVDSDNIPIDSNTNDTLAYTPLVSAFNNTATFTGYNSANGGGPRSNEQAVTFDFTAQHFTLPTRFAFAYRDINPDSTHAPGSGFSVFTTSATPTVGASPSGILSAYPNNLSGTDFSFDGDTRSANIQATIRATAVPEPSALGLLALGALSAVRRRK